MATKDKEKDKEAEKEKTTEEEKDDRGTAKDIARVANEISAASYDIGSLVDVLSHKFYSQLLEKQTKDEKIDPKRYVEIMNKHNVILYYFQLIVYVCKGENKLGSKEEEYVRRYSKAWGLPDDKIDDVLKGEDCSVQYQTAVAKYWKEAMPNATNDDLIVLVNAFKNDVVLYSMLAASQDGLVLSEYSAALKLAAKLGLGKDVVKENVNIIKAEKRLAQLANARYMGE